RLPSFLRLVFVFFFFSSRRRHTRFSRDWSSDVCSSDLAVREASVQRRVYLFGQLAADAVDTAQILDGGRAHAVETAEGLDQAAEIGRASCRERVEISGGAGASKEKRRGGGDNWCMYVAR